MNSASVHCLWTHKFHFLSPFSLKMGLTALFTHLKIILLQCFQFSVFNFNKISSIQTDPKCDLCFYQHYCLCFLATKLVSPPTQTRNINLKINATINLKINPAYAYQQFKKKKKSVLYSLKLKFNFQLLL